MANNGLLFVPNAAKTLNLFMTASKFVKKVLYININESVEESLPIISRQIDKIYSQASHYCHNLDVRLILKQSMGVQTIKTHYPIELILHDNVQKEVDNLKSIIVNITPKYTLKTIDSSDVLQDTVALETVKKYEYVALGGTFDRLHNGHKILLSQAVLRASKHVTVGVTDVNMIQSKKLWELIEPLENRIEAVHNFLTDINPDLEYNVIPLHDLYGPTKDDPRFQLIIVSEETLKGATKINEKRLDNGLAPLDTYVIKLAQDAHPNLSKEEEAKISSSNQRMRLLGTLLKPPVPNPLIPDWPYVIGLAGGIASGKSNIAEKLKVKGAAIVNCDLIAHDLYKPGLPLNRTLAETFGKHIINDQGEIDRPKLGSIVFSNKEKLEKLNEILWPAIIEEARNRINAFTEQGYSVVVMEAAVMVRAKWYKYCHQLWSVIIPPNEAVIRLQNRNGLSEEEAKMRISGQPSNLEQVAQANVVFSPYWSYDYTQSQIDRAWDQLQEFLKNRK